MSDLIDWNGLLEKRLAEIAALKAENERLKEFVQRNAKYSYISLEALAAELCLPKTFLRNLANKGDIPKLDVNGRLRFNPVAVQKALDELAAKGGGHA